MTTRRFVFPAAMLAGCVSTVCLAAEKPATLKYSAKPGEQRIYRAVTRIKQDQKIGDFNADIVWTEDNVSAWSLDKIDDAGKLHWQIENKQLSLKMESKAFGKYVFDSKSDKRDKSSYFGGAITPIYESLSGAFLKVAHDPTGRVNKVKEYETLIGSLVKDHPYAQQVTYGGTDKGAMFRFQEVLPIFSDKAVRPGQSWKAEYSFELPKIGRVKGTKTFRYDGPGRYRGRATGKVSFSYDITFELDGKAGGMKFSGALPVKESSGTAHFDPATGRLLHLTASLTFDGSMSLEMGDNTVDVPTRIRWTQEADLLDKLPD